MMVEPSGSYESDLPVAPGGLLAEELVARGMNRMALAKALGLSARAFGALLTGKRPLDAETALDLERVLGIPAAFWLRLEASYRLALAKQRRQANTA